MNNLSDNLFHKTFLTILRGEDILDTTFKRVSDLDYKKINFDTLPKTTDTVIRVAPFLLQAMKKEQCLDTSTQEYYIATDVPTNTKYICYRNLLMIDIDNKHGNSYTEDFILKHFSNIPCSTFSIFKSVQGYHVFCISHKFDYRNVQTMQFMIDNFSDFYYCVYSYIRGFSVRLNRKFNEPNNKSLYIDLGVFGDNLCIQQDLVDLVNIHVTAAEQFKDTISLL
jgi:hypothetical protein